MLCFFALKKEVQPNEWITETRPLQTKHYGTEQTPNIITRTSTESTDNRGVKHKQSCRVCLFTCFGGAAFRDIVFFPTTDLKHSDPRPATHRYPTRLLVAVAKHQLFVRVMREEPSRALHNNNKNKKTKTKQRHPTETSGPLLRKVAEIVEKSRLHVRTDRTRVQKGPALTESSAITYAALWASLGWSPGHQEVASKLSPATGEPQVNGYTSSREISIPVTKALGEISGVEQFWLGFSSLSRTVAINLTRYM